MSQLHRSPGVDFSVELHTGEKKLHSCWIIPERGSWIELNVTKKDDDRGPHRPVAASSRRRRCSARMETEVLQFGLRDHPRVLRRREGQAEEVRSRGQVCEASSWATYAVGDILDAASGEPFVRSGEEITAGSCPRPSPRASVTRGRRPASDPDDFLILNTLREDTTTSSHEEALLKIYGRLRPGNPPSAGEGARALPGEVLRPHSLSPREGRSLPSQPEVQPGRLPRIEHDPAADRLRPRDPLHALGLRAG